jgi:hypothetical protein
LENRQIRSDFGSRLKAIEGIEGPFAHKFDGASPPLARVLKLDIHWETHFWTGTLGLTPTELDEIRRREKLWPVYIDVSKKTNWAATLSVRVQEWRGGYTHIAVENPFPSHGPESIELYSGYSRTKLWRFSLPTPADLFLSDLILDMDGQRAKLYATGSRFSSEDAIESWRTVFLSIPLHEGPEAEGYYDDTCLPDWNRRYRHIDSQKGLAWDLWFQDFDLRARCEGQEDEARRLLLMEWKSRFAWDDAGKQWFERIVKGIERALEESAAAKQKELAESAVQSAAREQFQECSRCGAVNDRSEFEDFCPHCGLTFAPRNDPQAPQQHHENA